MKPTGDFSRYYCFDHEVDFETRKDASRHLVKVHGMTEDQAVEKLDSIDEMYDEMDTFDDEVQ